VSQSLTTRMIVHTTLWLLAMQALLLLAGGDWRWPQAWVFLAESAVSTFAVSFWLLRHDPALLASRMSFRVRPDQKPWDRIFLLSAIPVFVGWMVLIAFDARRFGWSQVPLWAQVMGAVLIALCMILAWQTFRFNSFAAPQVRVQADRAHRVISDGPYRFVRHPMYAGAALYFLGMPLLLGSWWGLVLAPFLAGGLGGRAVGEERMLRRELPGYDDYASRVRFRLVPGLW
jgi:protein-S-isoprenylcysteine O-methyltransferase Ste14